jgi:bifunctional UDP-N-acetylglucosamine pyrophosphorylase/glucosamine-1-phosphate N-acetyltransferase
MTQIRTIILAAGKGTRMRSDTAKVLHAVCGRPMIEYVVDVARTVSSLIYVVLGHQSDCVKAHLGSSVVPVLQKQLLGTADAIKAVRLQIKDYQGDIVILCGDAPLLTKESLKRVVDCHKKSGAACTFLTACLDNASGYGRVIRDGDMKPVAIREEKDASSDEKNINEINTGIYCFQAKELLSALANVSMNTKKKEFYLTDVIEILAKQQRKIEAVMLENSIEGLGINTRKDLAIADFVMRQRILERHMENGVTIVDPQTTYIASDVKIGQDTVIRPCTVIENNVVIGKHCVIGPFCHLRPKTRIKDKVEVGNFTEVSRSTLGEQSLMKHFSFLGDATVGKNANIGAGVVTANYDGKNKNKTLIGNQAFIGSDSILVAPVSIGEQAVTGAGCVVTKGKKVLRGQVIVGVPGKILKRGKRS